MGRRYVTLKEKADRLEDKKNKIREQLANPLLSPEKKKNGAMLYKITDQFPTSGLYNVSPIL